MKMNPKGPREILITTENSGERSAVIWDPSTGSMLAQLKNSPTLGSNTLQLLKDSYILAADASKPRLHIWPLNSQIPTLNHRLVTPGHVSALACSSSGTYIVASVSEKIFIWQISTGKLLKTLTHHYQTITCLKFSPDNSNFASAGEDSLVFLWSLARVVNNYKDASPLHGFTDHTLPVKDLHMGASGTAARLVTVSLDRTARIYDINSGIQLLVLVFDVPLTSVCLDLRDSNMFVGCTTGVIRQFNLSAPPRTKQYHIPGEKDGGICFKAHTSSVTTVTVSNDCITLLSGSIDGYINIWDIPSRHVVRCIYQKSPITNAIFVPTYVNFNANILKPKVLLKPLQRVTGGTEKSDTVIDIISYTDDEDLLRFDQFFDIYKSNDETNMIKLSQVQSELEKLKTINSKMYKYGVQCILNKK